MTCFSPELPCFLIIKNHPEKAKKRCSTPTIIFKMLIKTKKIFFKPMRLAK